MAAQPLAAYPTEHPRRGPIGPPRGQVGEEVPRYRLHVVAPSVADAVTSAGGLICDRAMAGWQVTVLAAGAVDDRAVQILGATVAPLRRSPAGPAPQALAVAADLLVGNRWVRDLVLGALDGAATDLLLWGRHRPAGLNRSFNPVGHTPSAAARAFKAHALAAQRACHPVAVTREWFFSAIG